MAMEGSERRKCRNLEVNSIELLWWIPPSAALLPLSFAIFVGWPEPNKPEIILRRTFHPRVILRRRDLCFGA